MKKLLLLLVLILMSSCAAQKIEPVWPVVITGKWFLINEDIWQYEFKDSIGVSFILYEKYGTHNINDTVK